MKVRCCLLSSLSCLLALPALAQFTPSPSSGGGSPAGSGTEIQSRAGASTFGAVAGSANVAAIANPSAPTVVPTCSGTCATSYSYTMTVYVPATAGWTLSSAATTVMNAASVDMTHFNTIRFPTVTGGICIIARTAGPSTGLVTGTTLSTCDGSTFPDNVASLDVPLPTPPAVNSTAGLTIGNLAITGNSAAQVPFLPVSNNGNNSYGALVNHQNFGECTDMFGNGQSTCYLGAEFLAGIGYYVETDLFQSDEIGPNQGVCTDANAIFKPCAGPKTSSNCASAATPAVCGSAAAGAVAIPTGITSVALTVNTTAVTAASRIVLTSDDSLTIPATTCNSTLATLVGGLAVTARTPGTSFQITYNGTIATNPLCISYVIVN